MEIILILIAMVVTIVAQVNITTTYGKYKKVKIKNGLTGVEVASEILKSNGLENIYVTEVAGELTDHYDPSRKVVRLSKTNFNNSSVAAISVAAHEVGHALQDKEGYFFLRIRAAIFPLVSFSSKFGYFAIVIGLIFNMINLLWIGIALELVILIFQLITLPVEFDASKRALVELERLNLIEKTEKVGATKVLNAAALTYVAGVATTLLELLRLILIASNRD